MSWYFIAAGWFAVSAAGGLLVGRWLGRLAERAEQEHRGRY